jgi:hypothetical protein
VKVPFELEDERREEAPSASAAVPRQFRIMRPNQPAPGALEWRNSTEKGKARLLWRIRFQTTYGSHPRHLLLGWSLYALSEKHGFATAGDSYLAKENGLPLKSVQAGLTTLDRAGAIIRVHVAENNRFKRRIYLAQEMAERGRDTPCGRGYTAPRTTGGRDTPHHRGTEKRQAEKAKCKRRLTTKDQARLEADRRAAKARGELPLHWLADDVVEAAE